METVYIETTIVSYLVARPSRDLIISAHQEVTRRWWQNERLQYQCVTSPEVLREAQLGDAEMVRLRREALNDVPVLAVNDEVMDIAQGLLRAGPLPAKALPDAIHAAVASVQAIDILLTWNCRHLANPHILRRVREFMQESGLALPEICTPIEIMGS
jgi:hypothetical protein